MSSEYKLTSKEDLIEIVHACLDQGKLDAAKRIIEFVQMMEREHREAILIEIRDSQTAT